MYASITLRGLSIHANVCLAYSRILPLQSYSLKSADMFWDFISLSHESLHQVTILMSNRGTPYSYRHMDGFSSHALKLVNAEGEAHLVKWHFKTDQGIKNHSAAEAAALDGSNPDSATEDLFHSIAKGDHPSWTVYLQVMKEADAANYKWNVFGMLCHRLEHL